jgi:hypothetical protein
MTSQLCVQVVLYDNYLGELRNLVGGIGAAIRNARAAAAIDHVQLAFGDSSPSRLLTEADLDQLRADLGTDLTSGGDAVTVSYEFFDANLGSGGGSNRLFERSDSELVWVLNPDTVPTPTVLTELIGALEPHDVAAADARQVPIENPKGFIPATGDAAWVAGSCLLMKRTAVSAVGGFDPHFFPMYCDDVDLSWRLRIAGWRVRHAPDAVIFHDKRLTSDGQPAASDFEQESGVLSRLFLAHRYNRLDVVQATLDWVGERGTESHRRAVATYRGRLAHGDVPDALPDPTGVADLDTDYYGPSRFHY